jgi:hypothetical protein
VACKHSDCFQYALDNGCEVNDQTLDIVVRIGWYPKRPTRLSAKHGRSSSFSLSEESVKRDRSSSPLPE